ncbi:putative cytochrome P450 [Mycobacterium kansasii]|uniref:Putative cytochrome P450 n=1 Tax=Mycobacterium kansasii TaxID=1768 RepID=A0A1V3WU90_MYCKA|nr:putative cytochrome P450 [Mycobacterium kansasii]
MERHLRRALGRRRQPRSVRARPLSRGVQRSRCQQRTPWLQGHFDSDGQPDQRRARRHPGDGRPEHRSYRNVLNPYLSPAAVKRWVPFVDDITRACLDERIEHGSIDFVDDLANVVPAVLTLALMGIPLQNWKMYSEPTHAAVYTPEHSPDIQRVTEMHRQMGLDLVNNMVEIRDNPRPGVVNALLEMRIDGKPAPELEILGNLGLLIGGGFDTTTALTAHALEWLSENPEQRELLSRQRETLLDSATEEFLRYFTPLPGMAGLSPTTSNWTGCISKRASGCGFRGRWPTATPRCSPTRTRSSLIVKVTGTSASGSVCTAASDPTWRAPFSSPC